MMLIIGSFRLSVITGQFRLTVFLTDLSHPDTRSVNTDEIVLPILIFTINID